jgi:shikimate dehydrogenase
MRQRPGRLVLLGHPVDHSLSPAFQNAALRHAALPLRYEALDTPPSALEATLDDLIAAGAAGNVTIPHKERVAARCARLTPIAAEVGAVNTFWVEDGHALVGDNTDVDGFRALLEGVAPGVDRERPVGLLGAGGAAAAVLAALAREGFREVRVHARTPARAAALCNRFSSARVVETAAALARDSALVVNATPAGLDGGAAPIDVALLAADAVVLDLVALPGETRLVHAARERGLRAADGLEMLIAQGALAFERWFGIQPDRGVMRAAVGR